jgi:hypothetical protein
MPEVMKTIRKDELERLAGLGRVVSGHRTSFKSKPPAPATAPARPDPVPLAAAESMQATARLMDMIRERLELIEGRKPMSYKFTINRDSRGFIESVDAVPVGQ